MQSKAVTSEEEFYNADPKHMRKLWHNVTGERLWYALQGYDVIAPESKRGMFRHGRILPPENRPLYETKRVCTLLLTIADAQSAPDSKLRTTACFGDVRHGVPSISHQDQQHRPPPGW